MKGPVFFDTNVPIYADDAPSPQKQARAIQIITDYRRSRLLVISLQVMQEYFAAATRKLAVDAELAPAHADFVLGCHDRARRANRSSSSPLQ